MGRYFREPPLQHFFVEPGHVLSSERRSKRYGFVQYASQRPDVALAVVWLVTPYFRGSVVRRSRLSIEKPLFGDFGNIHVSK